MVVHHGGPSLIPALRQRQTGLWNSKPAWPTEQVPVARAVRETLFQQTKQSKRHFQASEQTHGVTVALRSEGVG